MCTSSCIDFVAKTLSHVDIAGKSVLETGAYDVNGSARGLVQALGPDHYLGVDMRAGPSVDAVCDAGDLIKRFGKNSFDVLITTEMFEHCRDWQGVLTNLKNVLRPSGLLVLTTRSEGFPFHGWPYDFWRFSLDDMRALFADFEILALESDPAGPGVFIKARKPLEFRETDLHRYKVYSMIHRRRTGPVNPLDIAQLRTTLFVRWFWTEGLPKTLKPFFPAAMRERLKKKIMYPLLHFFSAR